MTATRETTQTPDIKFQELKELLGKNGVLEIEDANWTAGLYAPGTFDPIGSFLGPWPENALLLALSDDPGVELKSTTFAYDELFSVTPEGIEVLLDPDHPPIVNSRLGVQLRPKNPELREQFLVYSAARFGDQQYEELLEKMLAIFRENK